MRASTSARVAALVRKMPRTAEVTTCEPGARTPRMDMQRCSARTSTSTPCGLQRLHQAVGDGAGEPLLQLQPRRGHPHQPEILERPVMLPHLDGM